MADTLYASFFDSTTLNAYASSSAVVYQRGAVTLLDATQEEAVNIGTLTTDVSQLNVTGQVSRQNKEQYYKFTLDGDTVKSALYNLTNTSKIRMQLLNSDGKVVADSAGSEAEKAAYNSMSSFSGLKTPAGEYAVRITWGDIAYKSIPQAYMLSLYSGNTFRNSYQTSTSPQMLSSQKVLLDNTMTFSTSDALNFSTDNIHLANGTKDSAVNIGWLYQNQSALSVRSQITDICDEEFYSFTLQKGDNLKVAFNNHTQTADLRVQLYDATGTRVLADTHGTEAQKAAYEALSSAEGFATKSGTYMVKVSYARADQRTKTQQYDFKVYSGDYFHKMYQTNVATENANTAIMSGHLTPAFNPLTVTAKYLETMSSGGEVDIFSALQEII